MSEQFPQEYPARFGAKGWAPASPGEPFDASDFWRTVEVQRQSWGREGVSISWDWEALAPILEGRTGPVPVMLSDPYNRILMSGQFVRSGDRWEFHELHSMLEPMPIDMPEAEYNRMGKVLCDEVARLFPDGE